MTTEVSSLERLEILREQVERFDDAWFAALERGEPGKTEKASYRAALAEFRACEEALIEAGTTTTCGRCAGDGVVHFGSVTFQTRSGPQRTCFACGGARVLPLRKHRFMAQAPTRWKNAQKHRAEEAAKARAASENWTRFEAEHPEVAAFLAPHVRTDGSYYSEDNDAGFNNFLCSMREKVERWGGLTEKQMAAVERDIARDKAERERKAKLAEAGPLVGGTRTVEGEIVSVKPQRGGYGGTRWRALILLTTGHKIYGTASERFYRAAEEGGFSVEGLRVRFEAEISRSDDDPNFGFYKNPKKVETLGHVDAPVTA